MNTLHALIIEDDPKLGVIFRLALQQAGINAEIDSTGRYFSERLKSTSPELILLDIHLPFASGLDLFEMIKANSNWAKAVIVVVTADLIRAKPLEGRADYVLIKPVSVERILHIIADRWPDLAASRQK